MATYSSVLAWRIPGMMEPDGLPSMGLHRKGACWVTLACYQARAAFSAHSACSRRFLGALAKHSYYCAAAAAAAAAKSLQLCPTLCDPIDSSPPGSSVPGILQARTLEWVAISFSNA